MSTGAVGNPAESALPLFCFNSTDLVPSPRDNSSQSLFSLPRRALKHEPPGSGGGSRARTTATGSRLPSSQRAPRRAEPAMRINSSKVAAWLRRTPKNKFVPLCAPAAQTRRRDRHRAGARGSEGTVTRGSDSFALPSLLPSRDRLDVRNAIRVRLPHSEHVQQHPPHSDHPGTHTPPSLLSFLPSSPRPPH